MLSIFFIGVALSMDAFSVSICLSFLEDFSKKKEKVFILFVMILHFIMPLLGVYLGNHIYSIININPSLLLSLILYYLGIVILLSKEDSKYNVTYIYNLLLIAFGVSIDSFSVGIGLIGITEYIMYSSLIFSLCAGTISYIGFLVGKYSLSFLKKKSKILSILLLFILATVNLCKLIFN